MAFVAVSCEMDHIDFKFPKGDFTGICITPVVDGLAVKSSQENGDDTYHENLISNYCWFIYSDEAGNTPLLCGQETGSDPRTLVLDDVLPTGGNAYVYVIANLPAPYSFDAVNGVMNGSTVIGKTFAALKAIQFDSAFYNFTSATTGLPAPENFVMRMDAPEPFSLRQNETTSVAAYLKRVAAKIILDLKVAQEVKQTYTNPAGAEVYKKTWQADISHLQVYMLWGSTHSDLVGNKLNYNTVSDKTWFYSASPRYAMYTNPNGGSYDASTNTVSGSVPSSRYTIENIQVASSTWEQVYKVREDSNGNPIWIWNNSTATADRIDANIGNKTYGDWDYEKDSNNQKIPVVDAEGNFQYTLGTKTETKPYYIISSLPLYSMPITWNVNDAHAPFIKVILPWQGCIRSNDGDGDITSSDPKTTEFYYKILVPERTTLDANGCYHISLDLSVLGSEADEVPVQVYGEYHVVGWNASEAVGGVQSAGRYLDCKTYFEFYSQNVMNIPVSSSHDIQIVGTPSATYVDNSSVTPVVKALQSGDFSISTTGNSKITISHTLETNLSLMSQEDISPITYNFTVQHTGDGGSAYQKAITVVQYPSLYITAQESTTKSSSPAYNSAGYPIYYSPTKDKFFYTSSGNLPDGCEWAYDHVGYVIINKQQGDTYPWSTVKNSLRSNSAGSFFGTNNNNPNMYTITTKVVDPSLSYVIGDPRSKSSSIPSASDVNFATDADSRNLTYYYPTEQTSQSENMISPSFRIASSYGKCGKSFGYDHAVARCAAYQEDGYPAGRWRVPTKSEVEYITTLSAHNLIPSLFNTVEYAVANDLGYYYWSANGVIEAHNTGNVSLVTVGEDSATINATSSEFSTNAVYTGDYKDDLNIEFFCTSVGDSYITFNANYNGALEVSTTTTGMNLLSIVITWYSDSQYEYSPQSTTIGSGEGTITTSTSPYTTTWTGSSSSVRLNFSSSYQYRAEKVMITFQNEIDKAFVRCVYDDWYWGDDTVNKDTFTWGDRAR